MDRGDLPALDIYRDFQVIRACIRAYRTELPENSVSPEVCLLGTPHPLETMAKSLEPLVPASASCLAKLGILLQRGEKGTRGEIRSMGQNARDSLYRRSQCRKQGSGWARPIVRPER